MKYLLFYFAVAVVNNWNSSVLYSCNTNMTCSSTIGHEQGQWTAELKNSKAECMDALKKRLDPTTAWCIPVNGYTNELTPY